MALKLFFLLRLFKFRSNAAFRFVRGACRRETNCVHFGLSVGVACFEFFRPSERSCDWLVGGLKTAPRGDFSGSRGGLELSTPLSLIDVFQDGFKNASRAPKRIPREPHEAHKRHPSGFKSHQQASRGPQNAPRGPETAKKPPRRPKRHPRILPSDIPRDSERHPRGLWPSVGRPLPTHLPIPSPPFSPPFSSSFGR